VCCQRLLQRIDAALTTSTLRNQIKILVSFYQIVTQVETIYDIRMPTAVRAVLRYFRLTISLGIDAIPFECIGPHTYHYRLLFWMLAPATVFLLVAMAAALRLASDGHAQRPGRSALQETMRGLRRLRAKDLLAGALPVVLQVAFLWSVLTH
jgi:hypothetical protein